MAKVFKRTGGKYYQATGYDLYGERWTQSTKQTERRHAEKVARRIEAEKLREPRATQTLQGCTDAYLGVKTNGNQRTLTMYTNRFAHLTRIIGPERDINELTLADAESYVSERLSEGVARSTVEAELGVLRIALNHAAKHGRFHGNAQILLPDDIRGSYEPTMRCLTPDELARLVDAFDARYPRWCDYVIAYAYLGVRRSELFRIRRKHVDFARGEVFVDGTKTKKAKRYVGMHPVVADVMRRRIATGLSGGHAAAKMGRKKKAHAVGSADDSPEQLLFGVWDTPHRYLQKASHDAGIHPTVKLNDLRRTFTSNLLNANVSNRIVADLLGHTTTEQVDRVYGSISRHVKREAVRGLPELGVILLASSSQSGEAA